MGILISSPEEKQQVRMDPVVRRGVRKAERVANRQSTSIVQAKARYSASLVPRSYREGD